MKTSLELPDSLFKRARAIAQKRGTTLRALIEEGLHIVLARAENPPKIEPKILVFGGEGYSEQYKECDLGWEHLKKFVYPE
jgi:hypothetical protein